MDPVVFLYVTAPDDAVASKIAEALVANRAAACVNILPRIRSIYRWQGAIEREEEIAMIIKTIEGKSREARMIVERLHPYATPAIAAIPVDAGRSGEKFIAWVNSAVQETLS